MKEGRTEGRILRKGRRDIERKKGRMEGIEGRKAGKTEGRHRRKE